MSAVADLGDAACKFEVARIECDGLLRALPRVDPRDRHSFGVIGSDIVEACLFVIPYGVQTFLEGMEAGIRDLQSGRWPLATLTEQGRIPAEAPRSRSAHFRIALKSVYFLIRSFQDAAYRVAFQVVEGRKARKEASASMTSVLKEDDPVRAMLGEFIQEYEGWFRGWRAIRDRIKIGQPASTLGSYVPGSPPDDIGVNFNLVNEEGGTITDLSKGTRVSDVTRAVSVSTKLVGKLTQAARTANRPGRGRI